MEPEFLTNILGNIGIPAALCFYTLFEVNKNLKKLADSINNLSNDVDKRLDKMESTVAELNFKVNAMKGGGQ